MIPRHNPMSMDSFVRELKKRRDIRDFVHHELLPAKNASYGRTRSPLSAALERALEGLGVKRLYTHQARGIDLVREGRNVVVMTPTASGKSLVYNIPVVESILDDPTAHSLYIFPLKGLEQDQLKALKKLMEPLPIENACGIYDGDTTQYRRKKMRERPPSVVFTNPDMLHLGICAFHEKWERLFANLKYVIIDEIHTYRGVLGSHVAQVMRRLRRIAHRYGSTPTFISCSATIANPGKLATLLTGLDFEVIDRSGAPMGKRNFLFLNPAEGISPYSLATKLFIESVRAGFKTIAFTKARKITELMHTWVVASAPEMSGRISSYRAGYLPEERRDIERRLFEGELSGVISTSALELGVDIGGLDVCILVGYPGTISSTWQRAGRVGRKGRDSLIIMVALEDALDQYFMRHPKDFFRRSVEAAVLDIKNRPILDAHLKCAVAEFPIGPDEYAYDLETIEPVLAELARTNKIWFSRVKKTWNPKRRYPHREVSIRGTGTVYRIFTEDGQLLGESSSSRVLRELHPGAIYLHRGSQYRVLGLHMGEKEVVCTRADVSYYTTPISEEETEILSVEGKKRVLNLEVNMGDLRITESVLGYRKKDIYTRKVIDEYPLELPPQVFTTKGIWMEVDGAVLDEARGLGYSVAGGLHALEHSAIAALPLYAMCDRTDLGGVSYTFNPELESPAVFIYDGHEGGVGLTHRGYEVVEEWFSSTLRLMEDCPCEVSCPSCTQDPHCGNNNEPLDKRAAIVILRHWLKSG